MKQCQEAGVTSGSPDLGLEPPRACCCGMHLVGAEHFIIDARLGVAASAGAIEDAFGDLRSRLNRSELSNIRSYSFRNEPHSARGLRVTK